MWVWLLLGISGNRQKRLINERLKSYMMEKVYQKYKVDKEKNIYGDCWIACICTITGLDYDLFPDINSFNWNDGEKEVWRKYVDEILKVLSNHGWSYTGNFLNGEFKLIEKYCIAVGKSPRGNFNHAVVWHNGIYHDPYPDGGGLDNIQIFEYLYKD